MCIRDSNERTQRVSQSARDESCTLGGGRVTGTYIRHASTNNLGPITVGKASSGVVVPSMNEARKAELAEELRVAEEKVAAKREALEAA